MRRQRGECGGPFLPGVPGGVTPRTLESAGERDGATWVPLHRIIGTGSPQPLRDGLWLTYDGLCRTIGERHARRAGADEACVPVYTCPLAVEGVSTLCPAPQPAPALNAAVEALGFARASLPWAAERAQTTEATRALALMVSAAQNAAEAFKAKGGELERGW